ncbi:MAG: alkaline phosphatase family protein, partial [Phycisphaerales bacterium]|nr:alkaline phosphatase family protein [Phycisphaerales bacterium]
MTTPKANDRKVLVIGWDAADWRVIRPMLEEGKLPHLKRFIESGVSGNCTTLNPVLSPMLWTSIATGKRPFKHGIHGFSEPTPNGKGIQPITNTNRKCKAIWNILNQCGKKANVVSWWPSHPAEPINGVMVSNWYQPAKQIRNTDIDPTVGRPKPDTYGWSPDQWPMPQGTVHPESLAKNLQEFRFHPMELTAEHIAPFIPNFAKIDQKKDQRLTGLAKTLADTVSVHGAATALMQLEPWDFMAVYYDGIDHFCHGFMKYHRTKQDWISEEDFEMYKGVVEGGYRFHDMMLGAMVQLAGEETTIILMSDHGFHPDHLRPAHIPAEPAGPAIEHRPYGIFIMRGPGIRKNETIHGASVLDLCPTVLSLYGLPTGRDMDGKPLITCFEETPKIETIESWENIEGECGMHPPEARLDSVQSAEAIKQLVELGYIEEPNEDADVAIQETIRELDYNVAQAYMDAGRFSDAIPLLERIWAKWPSEHRFGLNLISCRAATGNLAQRSFEIESLGTNMIEQRDKAIEEINALREEVEEYSITLPEFTRNSDGQW